MKAALPTLLNQSVLVLNQSYEPLHVCSVRRAIVLIFRGRAEVVEGRADCGMLGVEGLQRDRQGFLEVPEGLVVLGFTSLIRKAHVLAHGRDPVGDLRVELLGDLVVVDETRHRCVP